MRLHSQLEGIVQNKGGGWYYKVCEDLTPTFQYSSSWESDGLDGSDGYSVSRGCSDSLPTGRYIGRWGVGLLTVVIYQYDRPPLLDTTSQLGVDLLASYPSAPPPFRMHVAALAAC